MHHIKSLIISASSIEYRINLLYSCYDVGKGITGNTDWSPAAGGGRSAIQFTSGVDAIVAGGGGGGGAGNTVFWSPTTTGTLGNHVT